MIQRIQTVYLFAVAVLMAVMMACPVGGFLSTETHTLTSLSNLSLTAPDGTSTHEPWPLFLLLALSAVVSLATIFLYKKRMLQIRLTLLNLFLMIGYYAALIVLVFTLKGEDSFVPSWTTVLPLIAVILDGLAMHGIRKDEELVKSYDRIR